jgi:hypothetical protein
MATPFTTFCNTQTQFTSGVLYDSQKKQVIFLNCINQFVCVMDAGLFLWIMNLAHLLS